MVTKKSRTGMLRSPSGPTSVATASSVISTGGVSAEWAATRFFPTLVTWQTVPSFFRQ